MPVLHYVQPPAAEPKGDISHDDDREDRGKKETPGSTAVLMPGVQTPRMPRDRQATLPPRRNQGKRRGDEEGREMTPLKAIRARCLDCTAGNDAEVRRCEILDCAVHRLRMGKGSKGAGGCLRPIRAYCIGCMNGQPVEVRLCPSADKCKLYLYRMGRRPAVDSPPASVEAHCRGIGGRSAPGGRPAQNGQPAPQQPALFEVTP